MLIGVYSNHYNPRFHKDPEYVEMLIATAALKGVMVIFFEPSGVDFENDCITGFINVNGAWRMAETRFPDVLINDFPSQAHTRGETEKGLLDRIPAIRHLINTKETVYNKMRLSSKFTDLIPPYQLITDPSGLIEFIKDHGKVVVKPHGGRQGQGIVFIHRSGGKYVLQTYEKMGEVNTKKFKELAKVMIEDDYLVQKYVHCRTKDNSAVDFRVRVQRGENGDWLYDTGYARISKGNSAITNISRGGRLVDMDYFLEEEYGDQFDEVRQKLINLALELAEHVNSFYDFYVDEFGVDLAIDTDGNIWLYELNTGPTIRKHTWERARNRVGFAIFLANQYRDIVQLEQGMIKSNIDVCLALAKKTFEFETLSSEGEFKKLQVLVGELYDSLTSILDDIQMLRHHKYMGNLENAHSIQKRLIEMNRCLNDNKHDDMDLGLDMKNTLEDIQVNLKLLQIEEGITEG